VDPYATESLWYQRAVDRYEIDPNSFVYSVPINAGTKSGTRVTATRAVFVTKHGRKAPVAVVGIQFDHQKWSDSFLEITGTVSGGKNFKFQFQRRSLVCILSVKRCSAWKGGIARRRARVLSLIATYWMTMATFSLPLGSPKILVILFTAGGKIQIDTTFIFSQGNSLGK